MAAGQRCQVPALLDRNGIRLAFLAYCSILRDGYAATADWPGVAPLRVRTSYEPTDYQPGVPPQVHTVVDEDDDAEMLEDVRAARQSAAAVILSLHWAVHYVPRLIAAYQPMVAKPAFDAGADLILDHHAHAPKAFEAIDGKLFFHSLSNFIMSSVARAAEGNAKFEKCYGAVVDPVYPHMTYGTDAKRSLIATARLSTSGVDRVGFLPVLIDPQLRPEILLHGDPRFQSMVDFMEWVSEGFHRRFVVDGDVRIMG